MPHSFGVRARTRGKFAKDFRKHGLPSLSTYLHTYKVGDLVDIVVDGSVHKGMPYKYYHGRTGRVWNVSRRAIGVELNKQVSNRLVRKRLYVRVEHVRPSQCQKEFLLRKKAFYEALAKRQEAIKKGEEPGPKPTMRRLPEQPKEGMIVKGGEVVTLNPTKYVNLF